MNVFMNFLVFMVVFTVIEWVIEKSNFCNKLVNKFNKYKYFKFILGFIIIVFGFLVECAKHSLNDTFGKYNIISIILRAILFSIYVEFFKSVFMKNKS